MKQCASRSREAMFLPSNWLWRPLGHPRIRPCAAALAPWASPEGCVPFWLLGWRGCVLRSVRGFGGGRGLGCEPLWPQAISALVVATAVLFEDPKQFLWVVFASRVAH